MVLRHGFRRLAGSSTNLIRTPSKHFSTGRVYEQASTGRPLRSAALPEIQENSQQNEKWILSEPSINLRTEIPGTFVHFEVVDVVKLVLYTMLL